MSVDETLARADADLAAGRVPVARQRLRDLVAAYPADLPVRRRLAEVYRLYGEPAEAGRWMYLEADRDPVETAAFEERYDTPAKRMRALRWRGPEEQAATVFALGQLTAVRLAASEAVGKPVGWDDPPAHREAEDEPDSTVDTLIGVLIAAGLLLFGLFCLTIAVLGLISFVHLWV